MNTQPRTIALIAPADAYTPCLQYLTSVFTRFTGRPLTCVAPGAPLPPDSQALISYGAPTPEGTGLRTLHIERSPFFGPAFLKSPDAPPGFNQLAQAARGRAFSEVVIRESESLSLPLDVLAASFFLLSGYLDLTISQRDAHGRLLSSYTGLPETTWDLPLVNHWFRQLNELLAEVITPGAAPQPAPQAGFGATQTICLTHDVDLLRKYRTGALPRHLVRAAKAGNLGTEWAASRAVLSGKTRDPYDSFDALYTVKERVSAPSTFFFMGCAPSPRNGDYRISDREAREHLVRAKTFGDEVALHGSWESADQGALLQKEKQAVETANHTPAAGLRQHYLRYQMPQTLQAAAQAGFRYDSTGGFPDRCGFKYGWSGPFQPFDLVEMKPLPIIEVPLICMDMTLSQYEKIPAELALERLTNLLDAATENVPGGAFVFLWHNTIADRSAYPGYWDTFEYFFSVASGSARFITLSQLCDEYEGRAS